MLLSGAGRETFAAVVRDCTGSDLEAQLLLRAGNAYAAHMIERHARTPQRVRADAVRRARAKTAEQIALSIEALTALPADTTMDEIRAVQARDDAATARRIGQAHLHLERAS